MAFAFTRYDNGVPNVAGAKKMTQGTFTNTGGSTGGDIDTGLKVCENLVLNHTGAAVVASAAVTNETMPCAGEAVTIVTVADTTGTWVAFGY